MGSFMHVGMCQKWWEVGRLLHYMRTLMLGSFSNSATSTTTSPEFSISFVSSSLTKRGQGWSWGWDWGWMMSIDEFGGNPLSSLPPTSSIRQKKISKMEKSNTKKRGKNGNCPRRPGPGDLGRKTEIYPRCTRLHSIPLNPTGASSS